MDETGELTVKINVDADEALAKLAELREKLEEIVALQKQAGLEGAGTVK